MGYTCRLGFSLGPPSWEPGAWEDKFSGCAQLEGSGFQRLKLRPIRRCFCNRSCFSSITKTFRQYLGATCIYFKLDINVCNILPYSSRQRETQNPKTLNSATLQEPNLPGKPVAYNYGLLSINYGLLWGIVASFFGLLGVPGKGKGGSPATAPKSLQKATESLPSTQGPPKTRGT